jgi:hypothetical protein
MDFLVFADSLELWRSNAGKELAQQLEPQLLMRE